MTFPSRHLAWLLLLLVSPQPASARIDSGDPLAGQRARFLEARAALKKADLRRFERLAGGLRDYPLYSYLDYARLRGRLGSADPQQVRAFLDTWADQPLAARLRRAWLRRLGRAGRWRDYLAFYTPQTSVTLQCYRLRAELALQPDRRLSVLERAVPLWLVGHSQPDACDPLFDALYASPLIDSARIWQRIRLAFAANRTTLAAWLGKRLSADDRRWVQRWRTAARQPVKALRQDWTHEDTPLVREILVHGLKRLARHKPEQAWKHWRRLAPSHRFSAAQRGEVLRSLALAAARRNLPRAGEWLALVPEDAVDQQVRTWRVRAALLRHDWKDAARWLDALKPAEQRRHEWRYWRAVAHERLGEQAAATLLYTDLAAERNFYGFLAADRLREPYRMNDRRNEPDSATLARVANLPGVDKLDQAKLDDLQNEHQQKGCKIQPAVTGNKLAQGYQQGIGDFDDRLSERVIKIHPLPLHNKAQHDEQYVRTKQYADKKCPRIAEKTAAHGPSRYGLLTGIQDARGIKQATRHPSGLSHWPGRGYLPCNTPACVTRGQNRFAVRIARYWDASSSSARHFALS